MATTRGIQGLPPEIFDIILDSLGGTKSTLQSCSLICRTWLQASRRRLFSDLCVQAAEGRLSQFLTFIDTHSDIAGYVRSLTLSSPARYGAYWLPEDGYAEGRVTTQTLVRIARQLPHLRRCQLNFVHVIPSPQVALADVENAFRDDLPYELHVLHVSGSPRQEINSFLELLSRFPIRRLELDLVTFVQDPSISPVPLSLTPHREVTMRDLWVDLDTADDGPGILSALSSALSPDTLRVFHCRWRYWYECEAVGSFLRNMGYSIFDLALDMSTVSWIEEAGGMIQRESWQCLNLISCTNLKTFRTHVRLPLVCHSLQVNDMERSVRSYRNLFSLLPHSVRTIEIYVSHVERLSAHTLLNRALRQDVVSDLVPVDFSEIEDVLLELPQLEKVVVFVRAAQVLRQGGTGAVLGAFPRLHAAGILKVWTGADTGPMSACGEKDGTSPYA